jgi:hypothetical protein
MTTAEADRLRIAADVLQERGITIDERQLAALLGIKVCHCEVCAADPSLKEFHDHLARLVGSGWAPHLAKAAPHLAKAAFDPFMYMLCLRDGTRIQFVEAEDIGDGWVRIVQGHLSDENARAALPAMPPCPRGVDIRLSEIIWVADAPYGS